MSEPELTVTSLGKGYEPRTRHNANAAHVTIAVARDFSTAGEKLTERVAGGRYVRIACPDSAALEDATRIVMAAEAVKSAVDGWQGGIILNVAGNGIYTWSKRNNTDQRQINALLLNIVATIHACVPLAKIVCGGQSGSDWGGAVAGICLGIPVEVTYPDGFLIRLGDGVDRRCNPAGLRQKMIADALDLSSFAQKTFESPGQISDDNEAVLCGYEK